MIEVAQTRAAEGEVPIEILFSVVDETFDREPKEARAVLEAIVELAPNNWRAQRLLERLETHEIGPYDLRVAPVDELLHNVMEAAENLLAEGLDDEALHVVDYVRRRYGGSLEARAWLQSIELLLD
jgi:hypothetical protein